MLHFLIGCALFVWIVIAVTNFVWGEHLYRAAMRDIARLERGGGPEPYKPPFWLRPAFGIPAITVTFVTILLLAQSH